MVGQHALPAGGAEHRYQQARPARFRTLVGEPDPFGEPPRGKPHDSELLLAKVGPEPELTLRVLERLEPWFEIAREVTGSHCSGRRLRVDAIIRPRDRHRWRNPDVAFGVEFKVPARSIHAYTGWIAQAVSYTHVDWPKHGRLLMLTCPGAASWLDSPELGSPSTHNALIAKRIMGQLDVGELVLRWGYGLTILLNGEHIWSERYGVARGKTWALRVRSGNR